MSIDGKTRILPAVTVRCNACRSVITRFENVPYAGTMANPVDDANWWDEMSGGIADAGGAIRMEDVHRADGSVKPVRIVVCDKCLADNERHIKNGDHLGKYQSRPVCPKCASRKVGTRFCLGRGPTCRYGSLWEHLHFSCERCKFDWGVKCRMPILKRLGNLLGRIMGKRGST